MTEFAPEIRELSVDELDAVNGGILPYAIAFAIGVGVGIYLDSR